MPKRVLVELVAGQKFGKLTIVSRAGTNDNGCATWHCVCTCEKKTVAVGASLRRGSKTSCGCAAQANKRAIVKQSLAGGRANAARAARFWSQL